MKQISSTVSSFLSGRAARVFSFVPDLFFPPRCPVCEKILLPRENLICVSCRRDLPFVTEPFCMCCGKPLSSQEEEYCRDCESRRHIFNEGRAVFVYEKGIRLSVNRLKFNNRREYIPFFGKCLAGLLLEMQPFWQARCLVPIPMHPKKRAVRGFDQAVLLAGAVSKYSSIPLEEGLLFRKRFTESSKKLGRAERRKNLRDVFGVNPAAGIPESAILIDDIYTTGATMDEAALALRRAGVRKVFFLTLCIGQGKA